jgi:hypothetical protein
METQEETVTISKAEYDELLDDSYRLAALYGAGVDNWDFYDDAMESYRENKSQYPDS